MLLTAVYQEDITYRDIIMRNCKKMSNQNMPAESEYLRNE